MSIRISDKFTLPLDIASQAIVEVGIRGSGKTNSARALAEELLKAGVPICVIDPTDAWWGLRSSRDGKGDGYPVFIFGGEHGDLPLEETNGKTIAEFLVSERVPVICSLRHLRKNAQRRFVTELFEELYHLKGKPQNRSPLTVFVDESPLFIPQRVMGEMARTVGAVEDLIARGRNAGFGVCLISQRFATINKDVSTQADTILCHRLTSPQDRKAIAEWIEENATIEQQRETLASLATLKNGEAWLWAPPLMIYERVQIRLSETFDSGATPKMGVKPIQPKRLAEIDRDKLRARMQTAVEAKKANDPAELKKRIAELEKAVKSAVGSGQSAMKTEIKTVEKLIVTDAQLARLEKAQEKIDKFAEAFWRRLGEIITPVNEAVKDQRGEIIQLRTAIAAAVKSAPAVSRPLSKTLQNIPNPIPPRRTVTAQASASQPAGDLSGPQQRILNAIAWWNAIGVDAPSRYQVGFVAGIKPTGGHFSNNIGPLSSRGLIASVGDGVALTESGTELATLPPDTPTMRDYHDLLRSIIKNGPTRRILDVIIAEGGTFVTTARIGELTGINTEGGHFSNSVGPLATLGLIERRAGVVSPTKLLFPEGLQ